MAKAKALRGRTAKAFRNIPKKIPKKIKRPFKRKKKPESIYPSLKGLGPKPPASRWKKAAKTVGKAALVGGLGTAAELGIMYGIHKLNGGGAPTRAQVKHATLEAGLNIADKAMKGNTNVNTIRRETAKSFNKIMGKTSKNNPSPLTPGLKRKAENVLSKLRQWNHRATSNTNKSKQRMYGDKKHRSYGSRQFGTGAGKKRGKKRGKQRRGKAKRGKAKRSAKRGKKKGKAKRRSSKKKRMSVQAAARRKMKRMNDVFSAM